LYQETSKIVKLETSPLEISQKGKKKLSFFPLLKTFAYVPMRKMGTCQQAYQNLFKFWLLLLCNTLKERPWPLCVTRPSLYHMKRSSLGD
jgi:hypothetical protein